MRNSRLGKKSLKCRIRKVKGKEDFRRRGWLRELNVIERIKLSLNCICWFWLLVFWVEVVLGGFYLRSKWEDNKCILFLEKLVRKEKLVREDDMGERVIMRKIWIILFCFDFIFELKKVNYWINRYYSYFIM